jgi:class 3 adenylate cyclase
MSEVRKWLDSIGLAQYADAFETNDLDFDLLSQVDDQLLKDIGVLSAGHRLRIRNAIAKLAERKTAEGSLTPPPIAERQLSGSTLPSSPPRSISSPVEPNGERRHVTVMFCDLVGSTSISAALDAEDWRDLVGSYLDAASAAVTEMGGHVAKKLGDGLMALFGYSDRPGERC